MRYPRTREKNLSPIVLTLAGILSLVTVGSGLVSINLQPIQALQQSQSITIVCNGNINSCQTMTCTNNQPCYTYQSNNDPVVNEQPQDTSVMIQPLEDTTMIQPAEDAAGTTQPPEDDMEIIEGVMDNE